MRTLRRIPLLLAAATLSACGGADSDSATDVAEPAATSTVPATTTSVPATTAAVIPTTTPPAVGTASAAQAGPDVDAVKRAYEVVFDTGVPFEQKAAYLEGGEALRVSHDAYARAGAQVGGIALRPTAVQVAGDTADVTYDVLFAGQQAYGGRKGDARRVGGSWVVSRDKFCAFLASARARCTP